MDSSTPTSRQLVERLELLRARAALHRVGLVVAREDLRRSTAGLRRGAGVAMAIMRAISGRWPHAATDSASDFLQKAKWVIPVATALAVGPRSRRLVRRLGTAIAAAALAIGALRFLLRADRPR